MENKTNGFLIIVHLSEDLLHNGWWGSLTSMDSWLLNLKKFRLIVLVNQ